MPRPARRALQASGLLVVLLIAVVALLPLLGGPALLLPAAGWVALAMAAFIVLQLALFRLFGLRSQADEEPDQPSSQEAESEGDVEPRDWRAWRG